MDSTRIYLDHNAFSTLRSEARQAIGELLDAVGGDPSASHAEGREATAHLELARRQVAGLMAAPPETMLFTSGGAEAIAAAVRGVCDRAPRELRRLIVSAVEDRTMLEAAEIAAQNGFVVVKVPCGPEGRIDVERFLLHLGPGVALAALQWANAETGVLQPVEDIGRACRERGVPFLVDAVQAAGRLELDVKRVFADLLAVSGRTLGGPQGTGALYIREGLAVAPLIGGGSQAERRRGGAPAVALLAGFGAAAEAARRVLQLEARRLLGLRARLETRLRERFPEISYHGEGVPRLCNTCNFALPGLRAEMLAAALDVAGFAVAGCSVSGSTAVEPAHVLRAMGHSEERAAEALRISLGWSTTVEDVDRLIDELPGLVGRIREQPRDLVGEPPVQI